MYLYSIVSLEGFNDLIYRVKRYGKDIKRNNGKHSWLIYGHLHLIQIFITVLVFIQN